MKFEQLPPSVKSVLEQDKKINKDVFNIAKYDYVLKNYESDLKDDTKQTLYLAQSQPSLQNLQKSKSLLYLNNLKTVQILNFKLGSQVHLLKKTDYEKEGFFFIYNQSIPKITIYKCI